ncbi:MAG TPA: UDP-2,3-diacylglucosamine diphosphatase [Candidatus Kapabacteria bacterium]|jgi:UDP-2,3-diacylglucosamine hydrolase
MTYYFISDVHLGYGPREEDRQREARLVRVLDGIIDNAKKGEVGGLFIVGDLFDSWFEFASVVPRRHVRSIAAFARIAELVPVEYLMGNHDFGHRDFFEKELSIPVHRGDIERALLGKRFYIAHGDGKAKNDTGYLILRKILRNPFLQACYRIIHPDLGIRFAEWISARSRAYTDQRDALKKQDGLLSFAEKLIEQSDVDFVVMGHRHSPMIVPFPKGTYVNLGDWIRNYTYGVFDEEGFRIVNA